MSLLYVIILKNSSCCRNTFLLFSPLTPNQKRAPSGMPTSTLLPWKRLREWGRSTFREGKTDWLSWRADGEGHQSDWLHPTRWHFLKTVFNADSLCKTLTCHCHIEIHTQFCHWTEIPAQQSIPLRKKKKIGIAWRSFVQLLMDVCNFVCVVSFNPTCKLKSVFLHFTWWLLLPISLGHAWHLCLLRWMSEAKLPFKFT